MKREVEVAEDELIVRKERKEKAGKRRRGPYRKSAVLPYRKS
ncbi:MAG: hypothetical protein QXJ75_06545 [Candidatus Bathyarchaeia archaeon]